VKLVGTSTIQRRKAYTKRMKEDRKEIFEIEERNQSTKKDMRVEILINRNYNQLTSNGIFEN
jgi:hypothetical protein